MGSYGSSPLTHPNGRGHRGGGVAVGGEDRFHGSASVRPRAGLGVEGAEGRIFEGGDSRDGAPDWVGLSAALIAGVPALLDEVRVLLGPVAPEYAEYLIEGRTEVVPAAEAAMVAFVEHAQQCFCPDEEEWGAALLPGTVLSMFEEVGHTQWREGFALRTLLSAYQVGGRVAWRRVAATALGIRVGSAALAALAEAVFYFVDELCAASTDGYVEAQTASAAEREHRRDVLVEMLLSDRSDSAALQAAASEAGWVLPKRAAVVFIEAGNESGRHALMALGPRCLPVHTGGFTGMIVPDADGPGQRGRLRVALRGSGAVVGQVVALRQLPPSARLAGLAAELVRAGQLSGDPVFVEEHLDAVIVHRDADLLGLLREQSLAPLADAAPTSRPMLQDTLRSWLRHMGDGAAVAEELHVHRQTVRYRLRRLRELFGPALEDPASRARLTLALAWDRESDSVAPSASAPDHEMAGAQHAESKPSPRLR